MRTDLILYSPSFLNSIACDCLELITTTAISRFTYSIVPICACCYVKKARIERLRAKTSLARISTEVSPCRKRKAHLKPIWRNEQGQWILNPKTGIRSGNPRRLSPAGIAWPSWGQGQRTKTPDVQSPKEESFENISGSIPLLVGATKMGVSCLIRPSLFFHPLKMSIVRLLSPVIIASSFWRAR